MPIRLLCLALLLCACDDAPSLADAEVEDAATPDMTADVALLDATPPDATPPDAGPPPIDRAALNEIRCGADAPVEVFALDGVARLDGWTLRAGPRSVALSGTAAPFASARLDAHCDVHAVELLDPTGAVVDTHRPALDVAAASAGRLPDGTGAWTTTRPTPDAPNAPWNADDVGLFEPLQVHVMRIELEEDAALALRREVTREVDGRVVLDGGAPVDARVQVYGVDGRRRRFDQKSAWRIRADLPELGGLEVDGGLVDPAVLTRWLASRMLRHAGIAVPRVGFVTLEVAGKPLGLHVVEEPLLPPVLDRWFASTWHAYRATRRDFITDHIDNFEYLTGPTGDKRDLRWVVDHLVETEEQTAFERSEAALDWPAITRVLAAEAWIGSVEGYGPARELLRVHFDQSGRLQIIPDGLDRALRTPVNPYAGTSLLAQTCRSDAACRAAYDAALIAITEALATEDWLAELNRVATVLRPFVAVDPQSFWTVGDFDRELARIAAFLTARRDEMGALAACLQTEDDPDGDGVRCAPDCAPDDPTIHPGARDACGNGIDEDCNGVVDDAANCPNCALIGRGQAQYFVCARRTNYATGAAICQALGAHPVKIDTLAENDWLHRTARGISAQDFWIGLTDIETEGEFVWYDGTTADAWSNWGGGEPNDYGAGEDCAHFRSDRLWNDADCEGRRGIICEVACDPVDADGDGADGCSADCDDSDPTRHPAAEDVCGDGIDQDCDGAADEGCGCVDTLRAGRAYRFCPGGHTYDAAVDICAGAGMGLIEIDGPAENAWAFATARSRALQRWWIGLTDRATEGAYRTADGRRPDFGAWTRGEPNDGGRNEDCVHFWEDLAGWNDASCAAEYGVICEAACDPATDGDGDGVSGCGEDCDDADPGRAPGLDEVCDGDDDDCDGVIDEGC